MAYKSEIVPYGDAWLLRVWADPQHAVDTVVTDELRTSSDYIAAYKAGAAAHAAALAALEDAPTPPEPIVPEPPPEPVEPVDPTPGPKFDSGDLMRGDRYA